VSEGASAAPRGGPELASGGAPSASDEVAAAIRAFQRGGDRERAFRLLFERFYRPLIGFFARKGLATDVCLDLTQETFLRIYRGLGGYRHEARFETWLFRIAATTHLKYLRSRSAGKRAGEEVSVEHDSVQLENGARQLDRVLAGERRRLLERAIEELPPKMRACLVLRVYHELAYRDIAALQGLSIQTVKAHLFQAKKKLEARLGNAFRGLDAIA